jgi:hypothetical protein
MLKSNVGFETDKQLLKAAEQIKFLDHSYDLKDFAKK